MVGQAEFYSSVIDAFNWWCALSEAEKAKLCSEFPESQADVVQIDPMFEFIRQNRSHYKGKLYHSRIKARICNAGLRALIRE